MPGSDRFEFIFIGSGSVYFPIPNFSFRDNGTQWKKVCIHIVKSKEKVEKVKPGISLSMWILTLRVNLNLRPLVNFSVCTSSIGVGFGGGLRRFRLKTELRTLGFYEFPSGMNTSWPICNLLDDISMLQWSNLLLPLSISSDFALSRCISKLVNCSLLTELLLSASQCRAKVNRDSRQNFKTIVLLM